MEKRDTRVFRIPGLPGLYKIPGVYISPSEPVEQDAVLWVNPYGNNMHNTSAILKDIYIKTAKKYNTIGDALAGGSGLTDGTVLAYTLGGVPNVVLTADINDSETITIAKDCVIHLNGHKISFRTGAHFDLKTGKLTIDGTVPGSEVKKCFPDSTESNTTSEFLVSASATTGNFELRLLGGTYSITSTHVSRTYAGIVPLSVNTAENGKVRLSGCTVRVTNCSGLAVYGIRSSCDMVVDRCRFELIIDKANEKYSASALLASNANSSAVIRNTTATVTGTDTEHKTKIYTLDLRSADCVVEKCTISATTPVTNICSGIDLFGTAKVVMNDCVVVSGSTTEAASGDYRALRTANGAEAQINGGYYRGDSGAFGLLSTIYIDGNQADETTHPEYEYCFAAEVETDAATLYVKDENGFWIAVC